MGDDIKEMALQNMIMKKVRTRESSPCRILWTDTMWNVNIPWASPLPPGYLNFLKQAFSNSHDFRLPEHKWWSNARGLPGGMVKFRIDRHIIVILNVRWEDLLFFDRK